MEKAKQHDQDIEAIIITGYGSLNTAVEGLRLGAFDYITKPVEDSVLLAKIRLAIQEPAQ